MNDSIVSDSGKLLLAIVVVGFVLLAIAVIQWLAKRRVAEVEQVSEPPAPVDVPWETRFHEADIAVRELISTLPQKIRDEAERIPFLLERWPPSDVASDTLGEYLGFEQSVLSSAPGPIMIYIGPHHELCAGEDIDFAEEIRRTYVHELGHHLGLDESELDDRGIG